MARSLAWTESWGIPRVPVPDIAGKTKINLAVSLEKRKTFDIYHRLKYHHH